MHSPIKDLALSHFTEIAPLARAAGEPISWLARLRARIAEWRQGIRSRNELARLTETDWAVGDYGIQRWQAEAALRQPFWKN